MGLLRVECTGFGLKEPACSYDLCDLRESLLNLTYYLEFSCVCCAGVHGQMCTCSALISEAGPVVRIWDFLTRLNWLAG